MTTTSEDTNSHSTKASSPGKLVAKPLRPLPVDEADGVLDPVQGWFLAQAERDGWVYTHVLRQLFNRMYRDRDYLEKRKLQGRRTAYDYAIDRDQKALSWAIRAIVRYVPDEVKAEPEPPKPPARPARRLSVVQRRQTAGKPSWNHKPKRDWEGPDLPEAPSQPTFGRYGEEEVDPTDQAQTPQSDGADSPK